MTFQLEGRDGIAEAATRRVGAILQKKWRLDALLGMGGSAAVYAATHRNGNRVAIKVLHPHVCLDEGIAERLQQEGYVANLIDHPGAVRVLDDDRAEDGAVYLVMELLVGESLDGRLKRKGWRLPRGEALGIVYSLLDVLAAAHGKGVVHRDIKPDNVFITREGQVKVLDFGIARVVDLPIGMSRTHNGALFGTLGFMAPEQALARSHEIDGRTDLWAVGATLFTLLSGRLVHEAPTPNEQLVYAATRAAPSLAAVVPDVDPALAALVDRALSFHPADRWQNAQEMQEAVRAVALATSGPLGVPTLQGPRVSVEVDIDAVDIARGRWASTPMPPLDTPVPGTASFPIALGASLRRATPNPTLSIRSPRRSHRGLLIAAVSAAVLAGVFVQRAWTGQEHPAAVAGSAAPLCPTPAAGPPAPGPEIVQAAPAPAAASIAVAPRRRLVKRVARAPLSVIDDDAVWGRRH